MFTAGDGTRFAATGAMNVLSFCIQCVNHFQINVRLTKIQKKKSAEYSMRMLEQLNGKTFFFYQYNRCRGPR